MKPEIPDKNLFMMCGAPDPAAFTELPREFHFRACREEELETWMRMQFNGEDEYKENYKYIHDFFDNVYGDRKALFFEKCLFACCEDGRPVGTCFVWKAYDRVNTLHWLKVLKPYEGRGLGRALLSRVLGSLSPEEYPVYLHTQPASYRAIKLYSDFGFRLLTDPLIGSRTNDLSECLPILEAHMPPKDFKRLRLAQCPPELLEAARSSPVSQF